MSWYISNNNNHSHLIQTQHNPTFSVFFMVTLIAHVYTQTSPVYGYVCVCTRTCESARIRNVIKQNLWNHPLLIQVSSSARRLLGLVLECSAETTCSAEYVLGSARCRGLSETGCLLEPLSQSRATKMDRITRGNWKQWQWWIRSISQVFTCIVLTLVLILFMCRNLASHLEA